MLVGEIRFILYWRAFFVVVDVCFVFFLYSIKIKNQEKE